MKLQRLSEEIMARESWVLPKVDPYGGLRQLVEMQPESARFLMSPDLALALAEIACYTTLEKAVEMLTSINLVSPQFAGDLALCLNDHRTELNPAQIATLERMKLLGRVRYFERLFNERRLEVKDALDI